MIIFIGLMVGLALAFTFFQVVSKQSRGAAVPVRVRTDRQR